MIRIRMPAISATMAGMWAVVMVIEISPDARGLIRMDALHFILLLGSTIADACRFNGSSPRKDAENYNSAMRVVPRNIAARDELVAIACRLRAGVHHRKGVDHAEQDTCHCSGRGRHECTDSCAGAGRSHDGCRARRGGGSGGYRRHRRRPASGVPRVHYSL